MFGGDSGLGGFQSDERQSHNAHNLTSQSLGSITPDFTTFKMTVPSFETIFAVPMTCQSCINDIEGSLHQLSGTSNPHARHSASNNI
jgi:hypothetical protein